MTTAVLEKKSSLTQSVSYCKLRRDVESLLTKGRLRAENAVKQEASRTYWEIGKRINQDLHNQKPEYGKRVFALLAKDTGISKTDLYDAALFARETPIFRPDGKLTWSHKRQLLHLTDSKIKTSFSEKIRSENWNKDQLRREIQKIKKPAPHQAVPLQNFKPRSGKLHTYRIDYATQNSKEPSLDLGFYTFLNLTPAQIWHFPAGRIVEGNSLGNLKTSDAPKNTLYTYRAELERVVDGDTLWVKIDLGFGIELRKKLRLRGIDCPELGTTAGNQAKKFTEDFLRGADSFYVTTTKPDKYDRYLSDIWLGSTNLNQRLLEENLAKFVPNSAALVKPL